jgi:hypothetical protein
MASLGGCFMLFGGVAHFLCVCHRTDQPKWDSWGRLFEPLLSRTLLMHTNGNHEIEPLPDGRRDNAYNHRYPTPQTTGHDYNKGGRDTAAEAEALTDVAGRGVWLSLCLGSVCAGCPDPQDAASL